MKKLLSVPSVGRIVHAFSHGSAHDLALYPGREVRAALIIGVEEPGNPYSPLLLRVFTRTGEFIQRTEHVPADDQTKPGHWAWPAFVPPVEIEVFEAVDDALPAEDN